MKTVTINTTKYPIHFNVLSLMNFGKSLGYTKLSEVQKSISGFAKMTKDVDFESVEKISKLIYYAIEEGCDIKNQAFDISEKAILRALMANPDGMIEAMTDGMTSMAEPVEKQKAAVKKEK